jgi:hypothetical protein
LRAIYTKLKKSVGRQKLKTFYFCRLTDLCCLTEFCCFE